MYSGDDVASVVIDMGSSTTKMGFAGADAPSAVFPSWVGCVESAEENGAGEGGGAAHYAGMTTLCKARRDVEMRAALDAQGVPGDWAQVERLWDYGLRDRLRVESREHPLLLAEPPHTAPAARRGTVERVFERLGAPACFLAKDPVLSCFATGREKGLVLDSGGALSVASCVHDGFSLRSTVRTSTLAGDALTSAVLATLRDRGVEVVPRFAVKRTEVKPGEFSVTRLDVPTTDSYRRFMVRDVARDIKETLCSVSKEPWASVANDNVPAASYDLPDGKRIEFAEHKFSLVEPLFAPIRGGGGGGAGADDMAEDGKERANGNAEAAAGGERKSIPAICAEAARAADVDVQRDMFQNIIVTGGNTMLRGFNERLLHELRQDVPPQTFKIKLVASGFAAERRHSVWIGGSILGSLGTFQQLWISKQEYEETGADIAMEKCP